MIRDKVKEKFERKLALKSRLFSWVLLLIFRKTNLELMVFMLDTYSGEIKKDKAFNYSHYLELKRRIEVVPK